MSVKKEDVVEFIKGMSVIELSEFVKELEDIFGVSAAAPVAAVAAAPAAAEDAAPSKVSVILKGDGGNKVGVIKAVKEITGLGLKEAKALVDGAPAPVKEDLEKDEAEKIAAALKEAGADVEVK